MQLGQHREAPHDTHARQLAALRSLNLCLHCIMAPAFCLVSLNVVQNALVLKPLLF